MPITMRKYFSIGIVFFCKKRAARQPGLLRCGWVQKKSNRKAPIAFVKVESGSAPVPDFLPPIISFFR